MGTIKGTLYQDADGNAKLFLQGRRGEDMKSLHELLLPHDPNAELEIPVVEHMTSPGKSIVGKANVNAAMKSIDVAFSREVVRVLKESGLSISICEMDEKHPLDEGQMRDALAWCGTLLDRSKVMALPAALEPSDRLHR